jgi:glycosyltransferase involved in cell wall biosynthesis
VTLRVGPAVSVVIPTYNRAHLITRAVESALRAISPGDEIIVVDDGSTDQTERVLAAYSDRIRYLKTQNRGAGPARNAGIQLARHDFIGFLDSDDEWLPDHLDLHRAFLSASDVAFSFSNFDVRYDDAPDAGLVPMQLLSWSGDTRGWAEILGPGVPYSRFAQLPPVRPEFMVHTGDLYKPLLRGSYVAAWASLVRRDAAGDQLRFPEDLPTFEDYDCYTRLAKCGPCAYLDCSTAINHGHGGPRLSGPGFLVGATARIAIMQRNWGSDAEYLRDNRAAYEDALRMYKVKRVTELVARGDTRTARKELESISGSLLTLRALSLLPGPAARGISRAYLSAKARLRRQR